MKTVMVLLFGLAVAGWAVSKTVGYMDQATAVMQDAGAPHGCG